MGGDAFIVFKFPQFRGRGAHPALSVPKVSLARTKIFVRVAARGRKKTTIRMKEEEKEEEVLIAARHGNAAAPSPPHPLPPKGRGRGFQRGFPSPTLFCEMLLQGGEPVSGARSLGCTAGVGYI